MIIIIIIMIMIMIMLVLTYITHNYYILIYYIITQMGRSPLDWACILRRHEVLEMLERKEMKLRK